MIKLKYLGGAKEVGKSAISLKLNDSNLMLDYGVKINQNKPTDYPTIPEENVDAILLSHAHMDHSGAIPVLYRNGNPMFFSTEPTFNLYQLLLRDSFKIADKTKQRLPFTKTDYKNSLRAAKTKQFNQKFMINNNEIEFFDAGHIPGSCLININSEKRITYTGDIKASPTHLLNGATLPKKTDILITESTYGTKNQKPRQIEEDRFLKKVEEGLANNQTILVPSFAVGRAQELLLMLEKYSKNVYIDGMSKEATEIISFYKNNIADYKKLKKVMKKINWIKSNRERDIISKKNCIILTTAGMMGGGPIVHYMKNINERSDAKILITGFQVEDTPGYNLLQTGVYSNENEEGSYKINAEIDQFDFSAHSDKKELLDMIRYMKPEKVICGHGDKCQEFADIIKEETKIDAIAPKIGEELTI